MSRIRRLLCIQSLRICLLSLSPSCVEFHSSPSCSRSFLCVPSRRLFRSPQSAYTDSPSIRLPALGCFLIQRSVKDINQAFSLALCFTSLSFALYSSIHCCFSRSDLAPSIFSFTSFLSFIFSHVLFPINGLLCFFDLPITLSAASLYASKILSWSSSGSSISPSASNLSYTSTLYLLLISSTLQLTYVKPHSGFLFPMSPCTL